MGDTFIDAVVWTSDTAKGVGETQTITVAGAVDEADIAGAWIFGVRTIFDGTIISSGSDSFGAVDADGNEWCFQDVMTDADSSPSAASVGWNDRLGVIYNPVSGAVEQAFRFDSWTDDGIVIEWLVAPTLAIKWVLVLFGGEDVAMECGFGDTTSASDTISLAGTMADRTPKAILARAHGRSNVTGGLNLSVISRFGFWANDHAAGARHRSRNYEYDDLGASVNSRAITRMDSARLGVDSFGADLIGGLQTIGSVGEGTFTINRGGFAGWPVAYCAMDFDSEDVFLGEITAPTSDGVEDHEDIGFNPRFVFMLLERIVTGSWDFGVTSGAQVGVLGHGVWVSESGVEASIYHGGEDAANPTNTHNRFEGDQLVNIARSQGDTTDDMNAEVDAALQAGLSLDWLDTAVAARILTFAVSLGVFQRAQASDAGAGSAIDVPPNRLRSASVSGTPGGPFIPVTPTRRRPSGPTLAEGAATSSAAPTRLRPVDGSAAGATSLPPVTPTRIRAVSASASGSSTATASGTVLRSVSATDAGSASSAATAQRARAVDGSAAGSSFEAVTPCRRRSAAASAAGASTGTVPAACRLRPVAALSNGLATAAAIGALAVSAAASDAGAATAAASAARLRGVDGSAAGLAVGTVAQPCRLRAVQGSAAGDSVGSVVVSGDIPTGPAIASGVATSSGGDPCRERCVDGAAAGSATSTAVAMVIAGMQDVQAAAFGQATGQVIASKLTDCIGIPTELDVDLRQAALDLIQEFGRTADFDVGGTPFSDVQISPAFNFSDRYVDGELVQRGDVVVFLAAQDAPLTPELAETVSFDGTTWRVVRFDEIYSGDLVALYAIHLRGGGVPSATAIVTTLDSELLTAAKEIIDELGRTVAITNNATLYPAVQTSPPLAFKRSLVDGELVKRGDVQLFVPGLELGFVPSKADVVEYDGTTWSVVRIEALYAGGAIALYVLHLRGGGLPTSSAIVTELDADFFNDSKELIDELGKAYVFVTYEFEIVNAGAGTVSRKGRCEHCIKGTPPQEFVRRLSDGELVKTGRQIFYVPSKELPFPNPYEGQEVRLGTEGSKWRTTFVGPLYAGGKVVLWEVEVSRR